MLAAVKKLPRVFPAVEATVESRQQAFLVGLVVPTPEGVDEVSQFVIRYPVHELLLLKWTSFQFNFLLPFANFLG